MMPTTMADAANTPMVGFSPASGISGAARQPREHAHEQRRAEGWNAGDGEDGPRAEPELDEQSTEQRAGDRADAPDAQRPAGSRRSNRRGIGRARQGVDAGLASRADTNAAEEDNEQRKSRIGESDHEGAEGAEDKQGDQHGFDLKPADEQPGDQRTGDETQTIDRRDQDRLRRRRPEGVQNGRRPQENEVESEVVQETH